MAPCEQCAHSLLCSPCILVDECCGWGCFKAERKATTDGESQTPTEDKRAGSLPMAAAVPFLPVALNPPQSEDIER